jgi:hypothetical protein
MSPAAAAWDRPRMTTQRLISWTAAGLATLFAVALLGAGGVLLWADGKKDDDGYLTTAKHPFTSSGFAVATADLDVDEHGPGGLLGRDVYGHVRLKATSHDGRAVFVGIARTTDVDRYLERSAHAEVTDVDGDPFHADYRAHAGHARPALPATAGIWAASAHGAGEQTLNWKVRRGGWSIVVMNADASRGVAADVSAGADVPLLGPFGWTAAGTGALLALAAIALGVLGARSRVPSRSGSARPPVTA